MQNADHTRTAERKRKGQKRSAHRRAWRRKGEADLLLEVLELPLLVLHELLLALQPLHRTPRQPRQRAQCNDGSSAAR
eukprot:2611403-Rhodomonas_salina.1